MALNVFEPSLWRSFGSFSKRTHSSFLSVQHTLVTGGDDEILSIGVKYLDVGETAETPVHVERFLGTIGTVAVCQGSLARQFFTGSAWRASRKHWRTSPEPVIAGWHAAERELRTNLQLPEAR
ncbi:MAG TPA: hypothetical protein VMI75_37245 [Polyangiaceae bacterium]|nr:hypothetical protein [Polyangiaceae bacterium]